jgi:copper(I)-binding protein
MKKILLAAAMLLSAQAQAADIEIAAPFMRAAPVAGGTGIAYLTVNNHGDADRLIGAESNVSKTVDLHTHVKDGDVYRMRKVDAIAIPMHGTVELKPGGDHLMFIGLNAPLKEGTQVPVTLVFEKAGKIKIEVPVQAAGAMAPAAGMMQHHGH